MCEGTNVRKSKKNTTRPATQVCLGTVESGLGGHEAGVLGDDEGVENTSIPLLKWMRMGMFVCVISSDFWSDENGYVGEKGDGKRVSS